MEQGYYETFRICFKDRDCWRENRETCYNFNLDYEINMKNISKYDKYNLFRTNIAQHNKSIFFAYPMLKKLYDTSIYLFEPTNKEEAVYSFRSFCSEVYNLYRTNNIYKNVDKTILKDLKKCNILSKKEKEKLKEKKDFRFINSCGKFRKQKDFVVFHVFIHEIEIERIYFTKNKIFKFGYNFFINSWVSTKKYYMKANGISYKNIFYDTNIKKNKKWKQDTILNRYEIEKFNQPINAIFLQNKYYFVEQIVKLELSELTNTLFSYHSNNMRNIYQFIENCTKNCTKYTIYEFQNKSLSEILNISPSMLKYINKNISLDKFLFLEKAMRNKYYEKKFTDKFFRFKMLQLAVAPENIKKIIKVYEKNNKNYILFFHAILKRNNPETCINLYVDYLKFIPDANLYCAGQFNQMQNIPIEDNYKEIIKPSNIKYLHDLAFRDYSYQKGKNLKVNLFEKFTKTIEDDKYKKLLDNKIDENYCIINPKNPVDLIEEGQVLAQCVGGYRSRMANGKSYIYFVRNKKNIETPFYTIEIIPKIVKLKQNKNIKNEKIEKQIQYHLTQCYGYKNTTDKPLDCKKYILEWCKKNHISIECII